MSSKPKWFRAYERGMNQARQIVAAERIRALARVSTGQASGKGDAVYFERLPVKRAGLCAWCEATRTDAEGEYCSEACGRLGRAALVCVGRRCPTCQMTDTHTPDCRVADAEQALWCCDLCGNPVGYGGKTPCFYQPAASEGEPSRPHLGHTHCVSLRNQVANKAANAQVKKAVVKTPGKPNPDKQAPGWLAHYRSWLRMTAAYGPLESTPDLEDLVAASHRPSHLCATCGKSIPTSRLGNRFCSRPCSRRFSFYRANAEDRCPSCGRPKGTHTAHCKLIMAQRDEWVCWLCQEGVSTFGYGPALATFDHVVPRAYAGPTTVTNLRLAHKLCNNLRGAPAPTPEMLAIYAPDLLVSDQTEHDEHLAA